MFHLPAFLAPVPVLSTRASARWASPCTGGSARGRHAQAFACARPPASAPTPPASEPTPPAREPAPQAPPLPGVATPYADTLTYPYLLSVVRGDTRDASVNEMLHALLGFAADAAAAAPAAAWADAPAPDFIGVTGVFTREVDLPVKRAMQKLTRQIPPPYKQLLKTDLVPRGFVPWKIRELTPNRTRRAVAVSWVLYYCAARGVSIGE